MKTGSLVMSLKQIQPSLIPVGDIGGIAAYNAMTKASVTNAATYDIDKANEAVGVAGKYLNDSDVLSILTDRVYELLLLDLRYQQERIRNYGKGRLL